MQSNKMQVVKWMAKVGVSVSFTKNPARKSTSLGVGGCQRSFRRRMGSTENKNRT